MTAQRHSPRQLGVWLLGLTMIIGLLSLGIGTGARLPWREEWTLLMDLRAPRTLGTWLAGACLGLSGTLAQGLFRNPLADPYLLGSAAGASLGVTVVILATSLGGLAWPLLPTWLQTMSMTGGALAGALAGVLCTLLLARGTAHPLRVILAGVVVGMMASALADGLALWGPVETWRARQSFMMGSTHLLGWPSVAWLALSLGIALALALPGGRALDALALGEDTARSLGVAVPRWRLLLILSMALSTGTVVAHAGLIAFIGLAAPHLVRQHLATTHRPFMLLASLSGGLLLTTADGLARWLYAPQELPVGLLTAFLGGAYWLYLMRRQTAP